MASLEALLQQLRAILDSIPLLENQAYRPPIIDGDELKPGADAIPGLRVFKDAVKREVEVLEKFLANRDHGSDFSSNAAYFTAVWTEILSAPPPIIAIGKIFDAPSGKPKHSAARIRKPGGIKVDVVADEGRTWIRVNTIRNSRILAELRELESYLASSGPEDEGSENQEEDPSTYQVNSLLRMGRALATASAVPVPGTKERPSVTLRLTRLAPVLADGETDPRIAQTIQSLQNMGINVELGERAFQSLHHDAKDLPSHYASLVPTSRINLDLSMLIALVSDLSHAELPENEDEAWSRFRMPINARSCNLGKKPNDDASDEDFSKHSRALSTQCIQEMKHGIFAEIVERLGKGSLLDQVEFWTTQEARERCLQIVDKIGGQSEKRRALALFGCVPDCVADASCCRTLFWHESRYPASFFFRFLPILTHPSEPHLSSTLIPSPFWGHIIQTCLHILSDNVESHPKSFRKDGEMERAKVTKANSKLTVHTVESLLVGARSGMTTLTANKSSVKAILREMKAVKPEQVSQAAGDESLHEHDESCLGDSTTATIWIVPPRSLAEVMRADSLAAVSSD